MLQMQRVEQKVHLGINSILHPAELYQHDLDDCSGLDLLLCRMQYKCCSTSKYS